MHNEAATAPTRAIPPQGYTFTIANAQSEIIEAIAQLSTTGSAQIALVVISLVYKTLERGGQAAVMLAEQARRGSVYLLQNLRPLVRKTDCVFLHQHTCYFLLPGAHLAGAKIVEERLWEALLWRTHEMGEQEILRPEKLTIGHGAFPDPHSDLTSLLDAASNPCKHFSGRVEQTVPHRQAGEERDSFEENDELPLLARKLGIPYLTLLPRKLPQQVLQVVNTRLAQELHCYPVGRERNMLTVAMLNPQDHKTLERLSRETGLRIFPVLTHPDTLENALKQLS
jgi:hypothetical protein